MSAPDLQDPPLAARTPGSERLVSLAVASALFMEFVDSTALSTALPRLASAFAVDPVHLKLALTSYILALAVFTPLSGWAADRFGARRVFLVAMTVFLTGSVLCGFARSLGALVAFRIVQGLGGALMTPVGRLIVLGSVPRHKMVSAMGWFTTPALLGPLLGPPLSGLILGFADWPWIFFINVPVGLLGMVAVAAFVPKLRAPSPGRLDLRGFALAAFAITALVVATEATGLTLVPVAAQGALLLVALCAAGAYIAYARRVARPVLDLGLLRFDTFRASTLGGTLVRLGLGASPFLMPMLLQVGLGWSPLQAGLLTVGTGAGALLAKPLVPMLLRRAGFRATLVGSVVVLAVLTAAPALFRAVTPRA